MVGLRRNVLVYKSMEAATDNLSQIFRVFTTELWLTSAAAFFLLCAFIALNSRIFARTTEDRQKFSSFSNESATLHSDI